jgi:hypothetical protein
MSFILSGGYRQARCGFGVSRRGSRSRSSVRVAHWTARTAGRALVVLRGSKAGRRGNSSHGLDLGLSTSEVRHITRPSSCTHVVVSRVCGACPLPATLWNTSDMLKSPIVLPSRSRYFRGVSTGANVDCGEANSALKPSKKLW